MEDYLIYILFGGLLLAGFLILALPYMGGKTLTGRATVVSRRVELAKFAGGRYNSAGNWNYLVTFRLSDGEEIELYASVGVYEALTEGMGGLLIWHQDTISSFEADMEVT